MLAENGVIKLYVRYFDVDMKDGKPQPAGIVAVDSFPAAQEIVPVIYLKNNVWTDTAHEAIDSLAANVFHLAGSINKRQDIHPKEIQFDCDWTDLSQRQYFYFIKKYRALSRKIISATIRLHQVKYKEKTGVPPVDKGVLMYYNTGSIGAGSSSSVYDRSTARKYLPFLKSYPLTLDVALPIFSWGILLRDDKVTALLNKMNSDEIVRDTNFIPVSRNTYRVKHSIFKGGAYLLEGDAVKLESIQQTDLGDMADDLRKSLARPPEQVIFYDFDALHFKAYDADIFQKTAGGF